ncbi:MAG: hypothetical protein LBN09_00940 [Clostridioides sp.]|nr:hypothetical protein [Clostridioides sp.]
MPRAKSMRLSKYYQIEKTEYIYLELIPSKNYDITTNSKDISKEINKLFKTIRERVRIEEKKLIIKSQQKVSFYTHISKNDIKFYLIIPAAHENILKSMIGETGRFIEIRGVNKEGIAFDSRASLYTFKYSKSGKLNTLECLKTEDISSRNSSILELIDDEDEVGILYNFIPVSNRESRSLELIRRIIKLAEGIVNFGIERIKGKKSKNELSLKGEYTATEKNRLVGRLKNTNGKGIKSKHVSGKYRTRKENNSICKSQIVLNIKTKDLTKERILAEKVFDNFNHYTYENRLVPDKIDRSIDVELPKLPTPMLNTNTEISNEFMERKAINSIGRQGTEPKQRENKFVTSNKSSVLEVANCVSRNNKLKNSRLAESKATLENESIMEYESIVEYKGTEEYKNIEASENIVEYEKNDESSNAPEDKIIVENKITSENNIPQNQESESMKSEVVLDKIYVQKNNEALLYRIETTQPNIKDIRIRSPTTQLAA